MGRFLGGGPAHCGFRRLGRPGPACGQDHAHALPLRPDRGRFSKGARPGSAIDGSSGGRSTAMGLPSRVLESAEVQCAWFRVVRLPGVRGAVGMAGGEGVDDEEVGGGRGGQEGGGEEGEGRVGRDGRRGDDAVHDVGGGGGRRKGGGGRREGGGDGEFGRQKRRNVGTGKGVCMHM